MHILQKGATTRLRLFCIILSAYLYLMNIKQHCYILALLGSVFAQRSYAQAAGQGDYNIWGAASGDKYYIYGRMANIRSGPDATAPIMDSLPCGTSVVIMEQGKELYALKNIHAPWMKVQYYAGNEYRFGYVWEGLLALDCYTKFESKVRFIYGLEQVIPSGNPEDKDFEPETWLIRLKVLDTSGTLLDEKEWKTPGPETSATGGKLLGDMGLSNTTDIVRIYFGGEACGVPAYYYYYGWTGKKLLPLPGKMEVGDAGVYYFTETMLFPKEPGGQPDKIIKIAEEGEALDNQDETKEPVYKTKKSRQVYLWNGASAVLQKK